MAKYLVRLCCTVEVPVEAENMQQAMDACDLNNNDLNQMPHIITEMYDVVEVEHKTFNGEKYVAEMYDVVEVEPVLSKGDEYHD